MLKDIIGQWLDKVWISKSNLCPNSPSYDRVLTAIVLVLDRVRTDSVHGQTFDRHLTKIGQRLDFLSNVCPMFVWPHKDKEYPYFLRASWSVGFILLWTVASGGKGRSFSLSEFQAEYKIWMTARNFFRALSKGGRFPSHLHYVFLVRTRIRETRFWQHTSSLHTHTLTLRSLASFGFVTKWWKEGSNLALSWCPVSKTNHLRPQISTQNHFFLEIAHPYLLREDWLLVFGGPWELLSSPTSLSRWRRRRRRFWFWGFWDKVSPPPRPFEYCPVN